VAHKVGLGGVGADGMVTDPLPKIAVTWWCQAGPNSHYVSRTTGRFAPPTATERVSFCPQCQKPTNQVAEMRELE